MSEYVTLKEIAKIFGRDKSGVRRYLLQKGFKFTKIRTDDSMQQLTLALTREEFERAKQVRVIDKYKLKGE